MPAVGAMKEACAKMSINLSRASVSTDFSAINVNLQRIYVTMNAQMSQNACKFLIFLKNFLKNDKVFLEIFQETSTASAKSQTNMKIVQSRFQMMKQFLKTFIYYSIRW